MEKIKIFNKIDYITTYIEELEKIIVIIDKNESSFIVNEAMERVAEKIIESSISINQEILTESNIFAKSYFETFIKLESLNLFEKSFLEKIAKTTGFKNRLDYGFMDLDKDLTIKTIKKIPELYRKYLLTIVEFLHKE